MVILPMFPANTQTDLGNFFNGVIKFIILIFISFQKWNILHMGTMGFWIDEKCIENVRYAIKSGVQMSKK